MMGQLLSGLVPFVDARDIIANLIHGDYLMAGLNLSGLLVDTVGLAGEVSVRVGKVVLNQADDVSKVVELMRFVKKHFPSAIDFLNDISDFKDAVEVITKKVNESEDINLTREMMEEFAYFLEETDSDDGLIRTSTHLDIKYTVDVSSSIGENNVWSLKPFKRGYWIDQVINQQNSTGLGDNFPVVDRLDRENRILVSTKSIDLGLKSYQSSSRVSHVLKRYADTLKNFEKNKMRNGYEITWNYKTVRITEYDIKILEIVMPDEIISSSVLNKLNELKDNSFNNYGIEVWFVIAE